MLGGRMAALASVRDRRLCPSPPPLFFKAVRLHCWRIWSSVVHLSRGARAPRRQHWHAHCCRVASPPRLATRSYRDCSVAHMSADTAADAAPWVAWEPAEWVAERGATDGVESEHFVVRWGAAREDAAFSEADALQLLRWLDAAWALFCDPASPQHFTLPYASQGWCCDGVRRKLNAYVCATGLAPWPGDASWAHQGTHAERNDAVQHASANPRATLHHSCLALRPAAARNESTVVHELTHVRGVAVLA